MPASGFLQGVASPIVSALLAGPKSRPGSKAGGLGRVSSSDCRAAPLLQFQSTASLTLRVFVVNRTCF